MQSTVASKTPAAIMRHDETIRIFKSGTSIDDFMFSRNRENWVAKPNCEAVVRGSIYSRKGGNRYDACHHEAKFIVEQPEKTGIYHVCGIHVRQYNAMNKSLWNVDDILSQDRRPAFYEITPL